MSAKSTSVVDANAIVSLLLGRERANFERARAFFQQVREGTRSAYLPAAVVAECVYVLTKVYEVSRSDAAGKLLALLDYRGVIAEVNAIRLALTLYRDHKVDFVDAYVAAIARERGYGVFSFDRDLERLAK
ncbi:MAG: PIN domain-containing protein [Betaproteobacteria bacterium]|nr:PIN domain-containing protein [Betaproteobacteria bacterium]